MIQRLSINAQYPKTLSWIGDSIIDWANAGTLYELDGKTSQLNLYHFAFSFDGAITSQDGKYAFIYKRRGTKGLLLKNGEVLREINRSYYHAESYEYPAAFVTLQNSRTLLVHCPLDYCRLDFEDVETGELLTNSPDRKPQDIFHSRLAVSPNNNFLISNGWIWHPWNVLELFDIEACLANPVLLDKGLSIEGNSIEICSASFIDNEKILVSSSSEEPMQDDIDERIPPSHLAVWKFKKNTISKAVRIKTESERLYAINEKYCWDTFKFPKIIDIETGEVVDSIKDISADPKNASLSARIPELPLITFNTQNRKLAILHNGRIEVLSPF